MDVGCLENFLHIEQKKKHVRDTKEIDFELFLVKVVTHNVKHLLLFLMTRKFWTQFYRQLK